MRRLRRRHDFANGADGDRFGERSHFEAQRRKREAIVRLHDIVANLDRLEAGELGAYRVRTWLKSGEREETDLVRDGPSHFLCLLVRDNDVGARNDLILRVDNSS